MNRVPVLPVAVFLAVAFGGAWLVVLPLWMDPAGLSSPLAPFLLPAMMFTPTLATAAVVFVLRTPAERRRAFLGLWPLGRLGRWFGFLGLALVVPIAVVVAAVVISGALGWVDIDLAELSGFREQLDAAVPAGTPLPPVQLLLVLQLVQLPLGAVINSAFAAGEEIGWRGWLQPALMPLGTWPALLLTGIAWGLWHSPVILLGYNFGRPDLTGVLLMVGGCVAWGVFFGWLRLRSDSVWPAVLAHGSLNAVGGFVLLVAAAGRTPDMALVGPLGVASWMLVAIVMIVVVSRGKMRPSPR
ncbi:CPBP family intramembrane glutamic endopeptidase [Microbacterium sp. SSW1-59]|uniref:CPBP family intramembrane glutamic endopeptidase n=1 Tax=Microbacterium xanthum TaxID=3079794 RepID=UPI002AD3D90E|nr:CPBP family intramembrane glutamic endopeptidase [Microbacterium sp. SSW1-59]MDZ8202230.1 CPBP family intramembrane glutamic endopeptidase [Microbacterium sp. SSW1-59]